MLFACVAAAVLAQPPDGFIPDNTNALTQFSLKPGSDGSSFDWADQEDRVRGTVTPKDLKAGKSITISLSVGPIAGDYAGPVTVGLESQNGTVRQSITVAPPTAQPRVWNATMTVPEAGEYWLKVGFRTTRFKTLKAPVEVGAGGVPEGFALAFALGAVAIVVGGATLAFLRRSS